jgi:four helix bundle protein
LEIFDLNEKELKERTKFFALRVMKLVDAIPNSVSGRAIANQLVRAGMSVGANYRAACRGRSKAEFIAKLGIVIEEADECEYWLELIIDGEVLPKTKVQPLLQEAHELAAIFVASVRTAKSAIINQKSKMG